MIEMIGKDQNKFKLSIDVDFFIQIGSYFVYALAIEGSGFRTFIGVRHEGFSGLGFRVSRKRIEMHNFIFYNCMRGRNWTKTSGLID